MGRSRSRCAGRLRPLARLVPVFGACGLLAATSCRPVVQEPVDLLLITVDTLRGDSLVCYGGNRDVGTAMCALADEGTRFRWAFATAPATAPSVASILTSRYPTDHGVTESASTVLRKTLPTVAELLSEAGYTTAAFISNPVLQPAREFDQGFDAYDFRLPQWERNRPAARERTAKHVTDAALAWARSAERPLFLWVHYQDPHGPYDPPDPERLRDPPDEPPLEVQPHHSGWKGIPGYQALPGLFTRSSYAHRYHEEIRYADREIERLVDGLDAMGQRPAVLLTADHGEAFGEDEFYFAHGHSLGLDQIRVPLLWRPVAGRDGRVSDAAVSTLDVAPSLLARAGVPIPDSFEGRPLPVGGEPAADPERPLFAEHRLRLAVIAGGTYYARDRVPIPGGAYAPVSGGVIPPLPPRTARLGSDGRLSTYRPAETDRRSEPLEALLASFLSRTEAREPAVTIEPDEQTRDALRALGYLE